MKERSMERFGSYGVARICHFLGTIGLLLFCVQIAPAQTSCIGPVTGVPANPTGPDWFVNPATAAYAHDTDDPRWVGAGSVSLGNGVSNIVDFRTLYDATNLYLSFRIQNVVLDNHDNTKLYFGFQQPAGADPIVAEISFTVTTPISPQSDQTGAIASIKVFTRNSSGPNVGHGTLITTPPWVADSLRIWTQQIGVTKPAPDSWAVQVKIPRSAVQITPAGVYRLWFEVFNATPANPVVDLAWPVGANITQVSFDNVYPNPTDPTTPWGAFQISTGPSDPNCATAGVSLGVNQIGTLYVDPMTGVPDPHHINLVSPNTFFARPTNHLGSGTSVSPGQITARFRIANWGSNPLGWEVGVDDNVIWSDVCTTTPEGTGCTPSNGIVSNLGAGIPDGTTAHGDPAANDIELSWTPTPTQRGRFQGEGGTALLHQCMLVVLSSLAATPIRFVNDSVRTNMNFAHTSKFKDTAEISLKGLPAIAPDGRDVYVWVEALNMPPVVKRGQIPGRLRTVPPGNPNFAGAANRQPAAGEAQYIPVPDSAKLQQLLISGETTFAGVLEVIPTYIVHVYHDTGRTLKFGGVERPILAPQGAFGYFVQHDGSVNGWKHDLVGDGFTLEKIAENFYRITKMPNGGFVRVNVNIEALGSAPPPPTLGRFAVFFDIGVAVPHGSFGTAFDPGVSFNAGLEYVATSHFSVEGIVGVHHFGDKGIGDTTAIQFGGGGKAFFAAGPNRPFVRAGIAGYHFTSASTEFGGYVGGGVLHEFNAHLGLEGAYTFHAVNTPGTAAKFSTFQIGLRYVF